MSIHMQFDSIVQDEIHFPFEARQTIFRSGVVAIILPSEKGILRRTPLSSAYPGCHERVPAQSRYPPSSPRGVRVKRPPRRPSVLMVQHLLHDVLWKRFRLLAEILVFPESMFLARCDYGGFHSGEAEEKS